MKGFIYKIYDNTNGNVYYGSTIQSLSQRISGHRANYKRWLKGINPTYTKSFDVIKNNDYDYSIVEELECENKYELHNRERFYIENNKCVNKLIPNRTDKEYYIDNKELIIEKNKIWSNNNLDKVRINHKNFEAKEENKKKRKEWVKDNRETINKNSTKYREKNKDIINEKAREKRKERFICDCGIEICMGARWKHNESKIHKLYLTKR